MTASPDRLHLVPGDDLPWELVREGQDTPIALLPSLRLALVRGLDLAESEGTALVIHAEDGRIRSVVDGECPDDLEVVRSGPDWEVRKASTRSTVGVWGTRNTALERALELVRGRGARVTLHRDEAHDLQWRNAGHPTDIVRRAPADAP